MLYFYHDWIKCLFLRLYGSLCQFIKKPSPLETIFQSVDNFLSRELMKIRYSIILMIQVSKSACDSQFGRCGRCPNSYNGGTSANGGTCMNAEI